MFTESDSTYFSNKSHFIDVEYRSVEEEIDASVFPYFDHQRSSDALENIVGFIACTRENDTEEDLECDNPGSSNESWSCSEEISLIFDPDLSRLKSMLGYATTLYKVGIN